MTDRPNPWLPLPDAGGPVTCGVCGCRLEAVADGKGWRHFPSSEAGQDGRGCRPVCVDRVHDGDGRSVNDAISA